MIFIQILWLFFTADDEKNICSTQHTLNIKVSFHWNPCNTTECDALLQSIINVLHHQKWKNDHEIYI